MTKYPKKGVVRVQGQFKKNPFRKSGMGETRNFKFGTVIQIDIGSHISSMTKYPQKGRGQGPRVNYFNFKLPFVNLEWVKLNSRNVKFGIWTDLGKSHLMHHKISTRKRGVVRSKGQIFKFRDRLHIFRSGKAKHL